MGWVRRDLPVDHPDFGKLLPCECRRRRFESERYVRFLRVSKLGHLTVVGFSALKEGRGGRDLPRAYDAALRSAEAYAEKLPGWLVLLGPPGSGKTSLAAAVATAAMDRGTPVLFMSVADLLDHLRSTYAPDSEVSYDELLEQVRQVPLLVLDDLGAQSATPWAQEKLWQVIGSRYNARLATVITSDFPLDSLDERLRARLLDRSLVTVVDLGAGSPGHDLADTLDLEDLAHMTFKTFQQHGLNLRGPLAENLAEAKRLAEAFAQHPEGWLVLSGGYGCGKTHLAAAIAHHRRQLGDDVLFLFVPDLLDYLRSTFNSESNSTYQVLDRVKRAGLLVLDDFSEPKESEWTREKLYQVLNHRYVTRLPTVITSGIDPEQLEPRIWSRMNDSRLSTVYEILAPDFRTGIAHRARRPGPEGDGAARGLRGRRPRGPVF